MYELVRIPEDRIAVLIGVRGETKKRIEQKTKTKIKVTDIVEIQGDDEGALVAAEIVQAIGRGFSPPHAFLLLDEDNQLVALSLDEQTEATRKRLFARVIGKDGKVRRNIETYTRTVISVYGKTASVIGRADRARIAFEALEAILNGRTIGLVYKQIEKQMRDSPVLPD